LRPKKVASARGPRFGRKNMETHRLHEELLNREVRVLVVGCGGTGSSILGGLPYLHQAMLVQGHPMDCMSP
jgi:hypothetical protein